MQYLDILPFNVAFNSLGTFINATYPVMRRIATFQYEMALGLLNYQFSAAVHGNNSGGDVTVALVLNHNEDLLGINRDAGIIGSWAVAGQTAAADFSRDISYATEWVDQGFKLPSRMPVSVYASAPASVDYVVSGNIILYTTLVK